MTHRENIVHAAEQIDAIQADVAEIKTALLGDLRGGKPGVIGRVDRLEQSEKRRVFLTQSAVGAAITAVVASVWSWLSHGR